MRVSPLLSIEVRRYYRLHICAGPATWIYPTFGCPGGTLALRVLMSPKSVDVRTFIVIFHYAQPAGPYSADTGSAKLPEVRKAKIERQFSARESRGQHPPATRSRRPIATNTTRLFSPACRTTAVPSLPSKARNSLSTPPDAICNAYPNQGPGFYSYVERNQAVAAITIFVVPAASRRNEPLEVGNVPLTQERHSRLI